MHCTIDRRTLKHQLIIIVVLFASIFYAINSYAGSTYVFNTITSSRTSGVSNVPNKTKVLLVSNATLANYSGSVVPYCGVRRSGPFYQCKDDSGNAISITAKGYKTWTDASEFIYLVYTKTKRGVNAWLGWSP